jgi:hypothetical protein
MKRIFTLTLALIVAVALVGVPDLLAQATKDAPRAEKAPAKSDAKADKKDDKAAAKKDDKKK